MSTHLITADHGRPLPLSVLIMADHGRLNLIIVTHCQTFLPCLTLSDHRMTMFIIRVDHGNSWSAVKYCMIVNHGHISPGEHSDRMLSPSSLAVIVTNVN